MVPHITKYGAAGGTEYIACVCYLLITPRKQVYKFGHRPHTVPIPIMYTTIPKTASIKNITYSMYFHLALTQDI